MGRITVGARIAALTMIVACRSEPARSVSLSPRESDSDAGLATDAGTFDASIAGEPPQDAGSSCVEVDAAKARAIDLDDGARGLITHGYNDVTVYVQRDGCFQLKAHCDIGAPIAFVEMRGSSRGAFDVSIETWLFHGDRRRQHYRMTRNQCLETGLPEEILGPRPPRH